MISGMMFLPESMRGTSSGVSATLTAGVAGATSVPLTLAVQGGTLIDWDLESRSLGKEPGATWTEWAYHATGIATADYSATLDPDKTWEFCGTARVQVEATSAVVSCVTPPQSVPYSSSAILVLGSSTPSQVTLAGATTWSLLAARPPFPGEIDWQSIDILGFGVHDNPTAPTAIWAGIASNESADSVALVGSMVQATNLVAPPAGTVDVPGIAPLCDPIALPPAGGSRRIVIRIAMPINALYAKFTNGTTLDRQPYGMAVTKKTSNDISGNPATKSGWGEAFGDWPLLAIRYNGLSQSVVQVLNIGDSHCAGYIEAAQGARSPFGWLRYQMDIDGVKPKVAFCNLAHSGHKSSQISAALRHYATALGAKLVMRQRATVNDKTFANTYTQTEADAAWAALQSDYTWCGANGITMYAWEGFGGIIEQPWYPAFRSHVADCAALVGADKYIDHADVCINPDGTWMTGKAGADGGHPTSATQLEVAIAMRDDTMAALGLAWA